MYSFHKHAFWQTLNSIINVAFPLITFPYITRLLGPENLGTVNYIDSCVQFIVFIAALGIPIYGVKELAVRAGHIEEQARVLYQLIALNLGITLFAGFCFFFYIAEIDTNQIPPELLLLSLVNLFAYPFIAEWFFQANQKFRYLFIRNFILKLLLVFMILYLITNRNDYIRYYLLFTVMQVAYALWNGIVYLRVRPFKLGYLKKLSEHIKPLFTLFATMSCISIYVYFDSIILGYLKGLEEVGIYNAGIKVVRIILTCFIAPVSVLLPVLSSYASKQDYGRLDTIISNTIKLMLFIGIPLMTGLFLMAEPIILLISGEEFLQSALVIKTLSPLPLIIGLSYLIGVNLLVPLGKTKKLLFVVFTTCLMGLPLQIILTNAYSFMGTAFATLLIEATVLLLCLLVVYKHIKFSFEKRFFFALLTITIIPFLVFYWIGRLEISPVYMLSIFAISFCTLVTAFFYLFNAGVWLKNINDHK